VEADRLLARAAELGEQIGGLVLSVALPTRGGGVEGGHGSAWVVDPGEGWPADALFNHRRTTRSTSPAAPTTSPGPERGPSLQLGPCTSPS
jgi:hypothetical protein